MLSGSMSAKAVCRMLMKLTPGDPDGIVSVFFSEKF